MRILCWILPHKLRIVDMSDDGKLLKECCERCGCEFCYSIPLNLKCRWDSFFQIMMRTSYDTTYRYSERYNRDIH